MIFTNHDHEHITGLIKPVRSERVVSEKSWGDFRVAAFPTNTHARGVSVPIRDGGFGRKLLLDFGCVAKKGGGI